MLILPEVSKHFQIRPSQLPGICLWMTGYSGAGKSTLAGLLHSRLRAMNRPSYVLDGDVIRKGLSKDLGFSEADRTENIRRAAEVSQMMVDAGLITIVAMISPFRTDRLAARGLCSANPFLEVFVDAPITVCETRDPKGLYRRARAGLIKNFTGIDSAYEPPDEPDVHLETSKYTPGELVEILMQRLTAEQDLAMRRRSA